MPTVVPRVLVIEAPGKVAAMQRVVRAAGLSTKVIATGGHLARNPESLWPLQIRPDGGEPARRVATSKARELLRLSAGAEVIVATDDDTEGEVIARDVLALVGAVASRVVRVRVHAVAVEEWRRAWNRREAMSLRMQGARRGDARRVLDRLIGHTFSRPGQPVGRVLTPLLSSMAARPPMVGEVRLVIPASDGGPPWRVRVPFTAEERALWLRRIEEIRAMAPMAAEGEVASKGQPWTYAEMVLAAAGRSIPDVIGVVA